MNVKQPWVMMEDVSKDIRRREGIMILLEAADFRISDLTRRHEEKDKYPYIAFNGSHVTATSSYDTYYQRVRISYKDLVRELKSVIKSQKNKHHESGN